MRHITAKINEEKVKFIFEDFVKNKLSVKEISFKYGIGISMIYRILKGLSWKEVESPFRNAVKMSNKGGMNHRLSDKYIKEIQALCKETNLSVFEIADKVRVSTNTVRRYGTKFLKARKNLAEFAKSH